MQDRSAPPAPIQFSIVIAVYNVARYLDEFIESVEAQTYPREHFEVVAVNDGSTDGSLDRLRAWEASRPGLVTIVDQANAGLPSARNAGLPLARGTWVTFADPDDRLAPAYLAEVDAFLGAHPNVGMVATRLLMLNDVTGEVADRHPLRRRFHRGNQLRYLDEHPDHFHGHAPSAFFPQAELLRQELRFDPEMRAQFEDGQFCGHYLLGLARPSVGFVATAEYHYRQRSDRSSLNQGIIGRPERYTTVPRRGYLDLLRHGSEVTGRPEAPEWLQTFILYQLSWFFSSQETHAELVSATVAPHVEEFHGLMVEILGHLSPQVIAGFSVRTMKPVWTDILLHGYDDEPWHTPHALLTQLDTDQQLVRITYRYTGDPPEEEVLSGGRSVAPEHAKVRDLEYLGRVQIRERILWVSSRHSVRLRVGGSDIDLQFNERRWNRYLRPGQIRLALDPREVRRRARPPRRRFRDRLVGRLARTPLVRRWFRDAWVVMDRIDAARDNGEHFFRYLRASHPDINAWFVIESGTADWRRLRASGMRRMIPHGSLRWKLLMLNCRHLLSAQVDWPNVRPAAIVQIREPGWRFTYLGHGVTQRDLSSWLNKKRIDLVLACTPGEQAAFVKDHTPYILTTKESRLTGMPRWDRLLQASEAWPEARRDLVVIAPTWRAPLAPVVAQGSHRRAIAPEFLESEYARNWLAVLQSTALIDACERAGLRIGFLPHPNMQGLVELLDLPPIIQSFTFAKDDVQEVFSRAAAFVTDYSSMAFDVAYIHRPIVYFQFDLASLNSGAHFGRAGYFDYERDGFGPVAHTPDQVVATIAETIAHGRVPSPTYRARMDAAFPLRDGKCCERALEEIRASTRRVVTPALGATNSSE